MQLKKLGEAVRNHEAEDLMYLILPTRGLHQIPAHGGNEDFPFLQGSIVLSG